MKILVACEESQAVTIQLRNRGHEAYSCDIQDCSGGHPEWHIKGDVLEEIKKEWDMMIAFPPCTYITNAGIGWFNIEKYGDKARERWGLRDKGFEFFMKFINADIPKIAVENPVGWANRYYRSPDQIIHPWYFGDDAKKRTCLWLKRLPKLRYNITKMIEPTPLAYYKRGKKKGKPIHWSDYMMFGEDRGKKRSKTFPGIAEAMAEQWTGDYYYQMEFDI